MSKYKILDLYEKVRGQAVSKTTAQQATEKLERVFDQLVADYGVTILDQQIVGLGTWNLSEWYTEFMEGRKVATVNNYVCHLNPFFRWAKKVGAIDVELAGLLTTNKIPELDQIPIEERPKEKYLTHDQAAALLRCKSGRNHLRDHAIIALFLYAGLRTTELCTLKIGSVYSQPHGSIYCLRKGGHYCTVHVADEAYAYLEAYLRTRPDRNDMDAPLFMTTHGLPCSRIQVYKALSYKQKSLDIATGGHSLRHTFVSEIEKVGSASIARDAANHKSLHVTNRYDHSTPEQIHSAVNDLKW